MHFRVRTLRAEPSVSTTPLRAHRVTTPVVGSEVDVAVDLAADVVVVAAASIAVVAVVAEAVVASIVVVVEDLAAVVRLPTVSFLYDGYQSLANMLPGGGFGDFSGKKISF